MTGQPQVRVGQVWADNDWRCAGRHVRVVEIDATHATVELCDQRGRPASGHEAQQKAQPGRRTRIRLDRFRPTSTGYRLVRDVEPALIPVPTDLGAVILAEVKSVPPGVLGPICLFAIRNPGYDEPGWDSPVAWIATEGTRDIYQEREITRVCAVLLPGEPGG